MNLSKNFTLEEAVKSRKADMLKINNSLPKVRLNDATYIATNVLQPIRDKIGIPFSITSWYRCPALNKAVGGKNTSAHLSAMAIDFVIEGRTATETFAIVLVTLKDLRIKFDQLIVEKNTKTGANWVHLAVKREGNRNESFSITLN